METIAHCTKRVVIVILLAPWHTGFVFVLFQSFII